MSDNEEKSADIKKELIVEFVKTAYDDALQPVAKELGKALGTLGKTINTVLVPLRGMVWSWEKIESYVLKTVERKLEERKVPEARIIQPNPDVAVPALEALRYSKLRENYAMLLATSMDLAVANEAHPSFVEILKQLTPDEAKILNFVAVVNRNIPIMDLIYVDIETGGQHLISKSICTLGNDAKCEYPTDVPKYIDNMCRLGLIEIPAFKKLMDGHHYERIKQLDVVKKIEDKKTPENNKLEYEMKFFRLTVLGKSFCNACVIEPSKLLPQL
jgi:hypothetical protein